MKLIVGLGNPGKKYEQTRHNIGFQVIDKLTERFQTPLNERKFKSKYGFFVENNEKVYMMKPQTFMNLSGEAVRPFIDYYKISPEHIVVIYDDLDLPVGKIRLRKTGGHGGHNGVKSLIQHLGTNDFKRIRIGIGRPTNQISIVNYVLQQFSKSDLAIMDDVSDKVAEACEMWLARSYNDAMNIYNK